MSGMLLPVRPRVLRVVPAAGPVVRGGVADYLEWMRLSGFSAETITTRRRFLIRLERELGMLPDQATAGVLADWRAGLTVTDRTVVRYVSHLRAYYAWAIEDGRREDNPAQRIPVPRNKRLLPRPVGDADLADALDQAHPRVRLWLILAAWCGLRAREIAYLRREHIFDTAPEPFILVTSEAAKGGHERAVPLHPFVVGELRAADLPRIGYVFPRADGKPGPNRPSRISQICGEFLAVAGIPASLHQFRHWFGTNTMRASHDLRLVQELMGHQSPTTTAGYAAIDRTEAAQAVKLLRLPAELTNRS